MRCVPSKTQIRDYSAELAVLFGDGPHIAISRIADMCDYVVQAERPNIVTMCRLFEDAECPILYRTAVQPLYPLPEFLPTLCRQFDVYWQSVLVGRFNHVDEVLWTLGALFRSIKPFNYGNAIIGHLIENSARKRYNLPWRLRPLDRRDFVTYHESVFCRHYGAVLAM